MFESHMVSCSFSSKSIVKHHGLFSVKVGPNDQIDQLKTHLVVKNYIQIFSLDCGDTFPPIAKMAFVKVFLSMAAMNHWLSYVCLLTW